MATTAHHAAGPVVTFKDRPRLAMRTRLWYWVSGWYYTVRGDLAIWWHERRCR